MSGPPRIGRGERPRLYQRVVERISEHVQATGMKVGDRLPPERDLAEQLGVSRATVAQALVALEVLDVIDVHHGSGAVLLAQPSTGELSRGVREHESQLPDIVDARRAVEPRLAALAAERRTDEDIAAIRSALELMYEEIHGGDRGIDADEAFHAAVTRAARSAFLAAIMEQLSEQIRGLRIESLSQWGRPERSLAGHTRVFEAIRDANPEEAEAAMVEHLRLVSLLPLLEEAEVDPEAN